MTNETRTGGGGDVLLPPGDGGENGGRAGISSARWSSSPSAAVFVVQALRMPFKDPSWEWYTAPNIFPLAMAVCLGAAALFVAIRGFVGWRANQDGIGPHPTGPKAPGNGEWAAVPRRRGDDRGPHLVCSGKYRLLPARSGLDHRFRPRFRERSAREGLKASLIAAAFIVAFLFIISKVFGIVFP